MLIKVKRGWELPEAAATPEHVFLNRRQFLMGAAAGAIALGAPSLGRASSALAGKRTDDRNAGDHLQQFL